MSTDETGRTDWADVWPESIDPEIGEPETDGDAWPEDTLYDEAEGPR
jgi:hypothetical protein